MSFFRIPLSFRPTPKSKTGGLKPLWLLPQMIAVSLLMIGILYTVIVHGHRPSLLLLFAIAQGILQFTLLARWMYSESKTTRRFARALRRKRGIKVGAS
jgi:hypothetical protein